MHDSRHLPWAYINPLPNAPLTLHSFHLEIHSQILCTCLRRTNVHICTHFYACSSRRLKLQLTNITSDESQHRYRYVTAQLSNENIVSNKVNLSVKPVPVVDIERKLFLRQPTPVLAPVFLNLCVGGGLGYNPGNKVYCAEQNIKRGRCWTHTKI